MIKQLLLSLRLLMETAATRLPRSSLKAEARVCCYPVRSAKFIKLVTRRCFDGRDPDIESVLAVQLATVNIEG